MHPEGRKITEENGHLDTWQGRRRGCREIWMKEVGTGGGSLFFYSGTLHPKTLTLGHVPLSTCLFIRWSLLVPERYYLGTVGINLLPRKRLSNAAGPTCSLRAGIVTSLHTRIRLVEWIVDPRWIQWSCLQLDFVHNFLELEFATYH
jgi:hypothetical protein